MPPAEPQKPHNGSSNALEGSFPPRKDRKGRSNLGLRAFQPTLGPAPLFMLIGGREEWGAPPNCQRKEIRKLPTVIGSESQKSDLQTACAKVPSRGQQGTVSGCFHHRPALCCHRWNTPKFRTRWKPPVNHPLLPVAENDAPLQSCPIENETLNKLIICLLEIHD